jgi:hypothetical protein
LETFEVIEKHFGVNYNTISDQTLSIEFFLDAVGKQIDFISIFEDHCTKMFESNVQAYLGQKYCRH